MGSWGMGRRHRTRREKVRRAKQANGVLRISQKMFPRQAERRAEEERKRQLLSPAARNHSEPVVSQRLSASRGSSSARPAQASAPQSQPEPSYSGREVVRSFGGAIGESLREKILDAVEPLWFAKLERDERNRNASAVVRAVMDGRANRRVRKIVSEKRAEIHPLYQVIEARLPTSEHVAVSKPIGPKVVQAAFAEKDIRNLLLFRGGMNLSRARAMFVFLSACMDAGIESSTEIVKASAVTALIGTYPNGKRKIARSVSDLAHVSGLHSPIDNLCVYGFLSRIRQTKSVWPLAPGIQKWAASVAVPPNARYDIPGISRWSDRTKREWRLRDRPQHAEFYPYMVGAPTDEYALVLAVHEAVPRHLSNELRADICQELLVDILSGNMHVHELQATDFNRVLKDKLRAVRGAHVLSLDEPIVPKLGDRIGFATRGDLLTDDVLHF